MSSMPSRFVIVGREVELTEHELGRSHPGSFVQLACEPEGLFERRSGTSEVPALEGSHSEVVDRIGDEQRVAERRGVP